MGKCSNAFFSEATNMIKVKLYMNVHWMVLYKLYVFCSDMKFKMTATAGLSLTLDPIGYGENVSKRFFSETTWTVETKLPRNDHWKVLCFLCRSEIQDGRHCRKQINIGPNGNMFKCLLFRNMIKIKLNMNVHWMVLYKLQVFCSDMKFKMATTTGLCLTLDPMGKMFQNASSLKPLGQLKPNCPGIII